MKKYDVIIAGAGPAGGSCARELAKLEKYKILIIDKEMEIGEPIYSTAGTPVETLEEFNLPKRLTHQSGDSILLAGPTKEVELIYGKTICYSLKLKAPKQFLVKKAVEGGAETMIGTTATRPIIKDNKIVGVEYHGIDGDGEARADIVVDASGHTGILASQLSLRKLKMTNLGLGVEFLMDGLDLKRNGRRFELYVGNNYIPKGYAWIFPTKTDEAKVGVGWIPEFLERKNHNLIYYLHKFIKSNKQTTNAQAIEIHNGFVYANGGISKHTLNGFIAIGDAACQINPLAGEGIRHALYSGRFAANAINNAIKNRDYSEDQLKNYEKEWKYYIGYKWKYSVIMQKIISNLNDKQLDEFIDYFKRLKNKEEIMQEFLFKYSFKELIKQFPGFLKYKLLFN